MIVLIIRPAPTRLAHPYRAIPFRLIGGRTARLTSSSASFPKSPETPEHAHGRKGF